MSLFYFGLVPDEFVEDHALGCPEGWEPDFYYRIRVVDSDEEIKVEDSCGRMVPFTFQDIKLLRKALKDAKESLDV